jgi:hypothetical protein
MLVTSHTQLKASIYLLHPVSVLQRSGHTTTTHHGWYPISFISSKLVNTSQASGCCHSNETVQAR